MSKKLYGRRPDSGADSRPVRLPRQKAAPARTLAGAAALAVVATYVFVSVMIVLPANASNAAKDAVTSVATPYFEQRWRLFAPEIARVNVALEAQAYWIEDGEGVVSDWLDITHMELASTRGVPVPSRISTSSATATSFYMSRYRDLTEPQQERAREDFLQVSDTGEVATPDETLREEFAPADDEIATLDRFLRFDHMFARFTTALTEAHFGRPVDQVRWRIRYEEPNDFTHRFDERQFEPSYVTFGWRQAKRVPEEAAAAYHDVQERYGVQP